MPTKGQYAVAGSAAMVAGATLTTSYFVSGWQQSFLTNFGTAVLLFIPLYTGQRVLDGRLRRTDKKIDRLGDDLVETRAQVEQSIEQLRQTFRDRDKEATDGRAQTVMDLVGRASATTVRRALVEAVADRSVSKHGIRVPVVDPTVRIYARLAPTDEGVLVRLERVKGDEIKTINWRPDESASDLMRRVADALRAASIHPGESFDPGLMFTGARDLILTARQVKERFHLIDHMEQAIQLCSPQWIVYEWGIGGWHDGFQPYYIEVGRLKDSRLREDMYDKLWLDRPSFDEALSVARSMAENGQLHDDEED